MDENKTIRFIRFINGDDIISEVKDETETSITLVNPLRLIIDADLKNAKQTIYMHSWMPQGVAKGNSTKINFSNIIIYAEVEEDLREYYHAVVFDVVTDTTPYKMPEKQYLDAEKKVVSIESRSKSNKDSNN